MDNKPPPAVVTARATSRNSSFSRMVGRHRVCQNSWLPAASTLSNCSPTTWSRVYPVQFRNVWFTLNTTPPGGVDR
jgi:hypothetical protein